MVVSLNGLAAGFFKIKSLTLSTSYSISEMKMPVIASINPLQPQQPERLHRTESIYTSKMCSFVTWIPGEPLL